MLNAMPYGTYILFGVLTYLGAAFIWFLVPETKRLTLEEMVRNRLCSAPDFVWIHGTDDHAGRHFWLGGHCAG